MKYKIYRVNMSLFKPLKSKIIKIESKPILINEKKSRNIEIIDPIYIETESVILDNKEYIQEKLHAENEVIINLKTYKEIDKRVLINHNYRIVFDSKDYLDKHVDLINNEYQRLVNDKDTHYDFNYNVNEINIPKEYKLEDKNLVEKIDTIDSIIEEKVPYFLNQKKIGLLSKEELDKILLKFKNDQNIIIEQTRTKAVRDKTKDVISITSNIVDEKNIGKYLIDKKNNDEIIKSRVEEKVSFIEERCSCNFETKEECIGYLKQIKEQGNNVINYDIKTSYRKKRIDEYFSTREDALNKMGELNNLYSNPLLEIIEEVDKEVTNACFLEECYFTFEEALIKQNKLLNIGKKVYIVNDYKEDIITIDNEIFKTEAEALRRVNELENISNTSIHYAITKLDNYYYSLSGAYYGYKKYYRIKVINVINTYIYHLLGYIDEVSSYTIYLTINKKITKYEVFNEVTKLGYNYGYEIKYKQKYYKTIYNIKSHKTIYNLIYRGIGYKDKYKTRTVEECDIKPIYKYETKIKDIVIKKDREENNKTYMKIA